MSLEFQPLRDAYRRVAADEMAASGEPCPPPEAIARFVRSRKPRKARGKILSHLARCGSCAGEAMIFARLNREIEDTVRAAGPVSPLPWRFLESFKGMKPWWIRPVTIGGLAIVLLGLSYLFLLRPRQESPVWRGDAGEVQLVAPVGKTVEADSWEFDWRPFPGAESYSVEVSDRALSPIWKSEPLPADRLSPPASLRAALEAGSSYYWSVSARLANGLVVKSGLMEFTLKR
jgi:hypothetical protein